MQKDPTSRTDSITLTTSDGPLDLFIRGSDIISDSLTRQIDYTSLQEDLPAIDPGTPAPSATKRVAVALDSKKSPTKRARSTTSF